MRAVTTAVVGCGGRLEHVVCQPPLTLRQVHANDPACCGLCLVGTTAGPLAGDDLELNLTLRAGATATLQATGASIAQGAHDGRSRIQTNVELGANATLWARPGTVIVADGASVDVAVSIDLAHGAHLEWSEMLLLGRTGQAGGAATLRWNVTRAGRPVLRQSVDLTDPTLSAWPGMLSGGRVLASTLISGPHILARTIVASETAVLAKLDEETVLVTVLGSDAAAVSKTFDKLAASVSLLNTPAAYGAQELGPGHCPISEQHVGAVGEQ
jgi:urease accessory protein